MLTKSNSGQRNNKQVKTANANTYRYGLEFLDYSKHDTVTCCYIRLTWDIDNVRMPHDILIRKEDRKCFTWSNPVLDICRCSKQIFENNKGTEAKLLP